MKLIRDWQSKVYGAKDQDPNPFPPYWNRIRRNVLKRDKYICLRCNHNFRDNPDKLSAHHLIPRAEGGSDHLSNLVSLCIPCHDIVECEGYKLKSQIIGSYPD